MNFGRQLDFLSRLLAPRPAAPSAPAAIASAESAEVWENRARELLREVRCETLAVRVRVRWNPRMRSTAGTAHAAQSLITLNPRLQQFGAAELDRTLRHELAHLLAHHRAGRRRISAHGPEWRQACADLGLRDETRCHTLPLPRRQMQPRYFYRCPECRLELRRVRPLRGKSACLACCRKHHGGRYHERFRLVKVAPPT